MAVNEKQLAAVFALPSERRFATFVKVVADREVVWGLDQAGWAMAKTDEGVPVLPLWPEEEYARACATAEWKDYQPKPMSLEKFMGEFLFKMKEDDILPGVFFTPSSKGVTLSSDELRQALEAELQRY